MADRKTLVQRIALDGGKEIEEELKALGKAGERAFKQLQQAAAKAKLDTPFARLQVRLIQLRRIGQQVGTAFRPLGDSLVNLGTAARGMAGNITLAAGAVTAAAAAVTVFAKNTAASAAEIQKQSRALGISVEAFQDFRDVAKESEIDIGTLETILGKFNLSLAETGEESTKAAKATGDAAKNLNTIGGIAGAAGVKVMTLHGGFRELGQAAQEIAEPADEAASAIASIAGDDPAEKLRNFALQIAAIEDPMQRLAAVAEIFGKRQAIVVLPFLQALAENLRQTGTAAGEAVRGLSAVEVAVGDRLDQGFDRLSTNFERLRAGFAVPFQEALAPALEEINRLLVLNQDRIRAFAQEIAQTVVPIVRDLFNAIAGNDEAVENQAILALRDGILAFGRDLQAVYTGVIVPVFEGIQAAAQFVADAINAIFGTDINARMVLITATIGVLSGAFAVLGAAIGTVVALIGGLVTIFGGIPVAIGAAAVAIGAAVVALGVVIVDNWESIRAAVVGVVASMVGEVVNLIDDVGGAISGGFESAIEAIPQIFSKVIDEVKEFLDDLLDTALSIARKIKKAIGDALDAVGLGSGDSGGNAQGFARGGYVRGPGGPTSDVIPAWLSAGEFVINARAVKELGLSLLSRLNRGLLPSEFPRFSAGGFVEGLRASFAMPRFNDGGLVQGSAMALAPAGAAGTPVHLTIQDRTFVLSAAPDTATDLHRVAMQRNLARIGRAPGWAGR